MATISEIAIAMRLKGIEVQDFAKDINRQPHVVSKVINGKVLNRYVEKEIIKRGFSYLLMKAQINGGIFDRERFDKLQDEIKSEENGRMPNV